MIKRLYAFDFDGTLTTKDTLLEFIRYARGNRAFIAAFALYLPILVLMKLHLYSNYRAKEKVFSRLFRGMRIDDFNSVCRDFARDNRQRLLRPQALIYINKVLAEDASAVVIVSASMPNWVVPFFEGYDDIKVVGTAPEVIDGKITGRFATGNCYGQEKVRRLLDLYPEREKYHLTAFGDSRGDKELLAFADEEHYKPFRQ